jgi:hypothetical protein
LTDEKIFLDTSDTFREDLMKGKVLERSELKIYDCNLRGAGKTFNSLVAEMLFERCNITYDFSNRSNIVFFTIF